VLPTSRSGGLGVLAGGYNKPPSPGAWVESMALAGRDTWTAVLGMGVRDAAAGAHDPADWTRPSRFPMVAASGQRVANMVALRALAPPSRAPVPRPSRPQPRTPWSRRHS
jgi:hypothetical protein